MKDMHGLEDFLALATTRSFTLAAAARCVSQPAFTRRIQQLESEVGVPLIDRTTTPIGLTHAGTRFLTHAQNLSRDYALAVEESRSAWSRLADPIRIAAPHTLAITTLPPLWLRCLKADAGLQLSMSVQRHDHCLRNLADGRADIALLHAATGTVDEFRRRGFVVHHLASDRLLPVKATGNRPQSRQMLGYASDAYFNDLIAATYPQQAAQVVFESASSEVLKAMALAGLGTAFLPQILIDDDLRDGYLVMADLQPPAIELEILLLHLPSPARPELEKVLCIMTH